MKQACHCGVGCVDYVRRIVRVELHGPEVDVGGFFDESEIYAVAAEENHFASYVLYLKVRREIDDVVGDVAFVENLVEKFVVATSGFVVIFAAE